MTKSVNIPSSKSISNRVLVMAMFSDQPKILKNVLKSEDTEVMLNIYDEVGIKFEILSETEQSYDIQVSSKIAVDEAEFYMNNSGTATRFLIPCLGLIKGKFKLDGCDRMRNRPIKDLIDAMLGLGVKVEYLDKDGFLPLVIETNGNLTGTAKIKCDISSQYLSGLLIARFFSKQSFDVEIIGDIVVSKPYIELTNSVIEDFANSSEIYIENDFSSASYFFALGCLIKEGVLIKNMSRNSMQADKLFLEAVQEMGAKVEWQQNDILVNCESWIQPLGSYNCLKFPDAAMTLAILCAFAEGKSHLYGLSTLKYKESDRLEAIKTELAKIGVTTETDDDSITIYGVGPNFDFKTTEIETYNDHRIAMCFSLFKLFNPEIVILNPECTAKTFPTYWKEFERLGI